MKQALLALIRIYQLLLSPYIGWHCRFEPTCSHYGRDAILIHGVFRGSWLTLRRLMRCRPGGTFGLDPVPHSMTHTR